MVTNVSIYVIIGLIVLALCSRRAIKCIIAIIAVGALVLLVMVPSISTSEDVVHITDKVAIYNDTNIHNNEVNDDYFVIAQINWSSIFHFVKNKLEQVNVTEWLQNCEILQKVLDADIIPNN